jgi:peptidoglycan/LPS O-acetylase OafA/YrhL
MLTKLPTRNLDVLRAIAVLCVLVDHTLSATVAKHTNWLEEMGRAGVLLFFVHTSLVLMASLERQHDGAVKFYVRRAFRIYPLAIVTILVAVALGLTVRGEVTGTRLLTNLTLTENLFGEADLLAPLWSLPLEVQMYVVLPFCAVVAIRGVRSTVVLFIVAVLAGLLVRHEPHLWRLKVALYGPCFVAGVFAYSLLRHTKPRPLPAWTWPMLVLITVAAAVLLHASAGRPERGWFLCFALGGLIALVRDLPASPLTQAAHVIATYSYGIYLLHTPALRIAFGWAKAWPAAMQWSTYAVLMVVLPFAAYRFVEKPGIVWGKRIAQGRAVDVPEPSVP